MMTPTASNARFPPPAHSLVAEVAVFVDITHTYSGDLHLVLQSPVGAEVVLRSQSGGRTDNIVETYTMATTPVLASFAGEPITGVWRLTVADRLQADLGKLNAWRIQIVPRAS